VNRHRACDGPNRARPNAKAGDGLHRTFPQPRMRRQAEVVVRGEVDDRLMVDRGGGLLFAVENAQPSIQTGLFERVELLPEIRERI
jgi:hypothetical protein